MTSVGVLDKTGTLAKGEPRVTDVMSAVLGADALPGSVSLIPLAAGVLYPVRRISLDPILAAAAMAASSVTAVGNALRLGGFGRPAGSSV